MKLARKIIFVLVVLFVLSALYASFLAFLPKSVNEVIIDISKGESAQSIADKLYEKNIIIWALH